MFIYVYLVIYLPIYVGVLRAVTSLDREAGDEVRLEVEAMDRGQPRLTGTATVYIQVECLSIYLSIQLSIYQSIYIYLSIYEYMYYINKVINYKGVGRKRQFARVDLSGNEGAERAGWCARR